MTAEKGIAVRLFSGVRSGVIIRISVGKTVRHNEIDYVCAGEGLALCGTALAGGNFVGIFERLTLLALEYEPIGAGSSNRRHVHVHEKIVGTVTRSDSCDFYALAAFNRDFVFGYALALHEQLERGVHTHPPGEGLHPFHLVGTCVGNILRIE